MNRQKMHRSRLKGPYYTRQFAITLKNKATRNARRQRRKVDVIRRQMLKKLPKNENHAPTGNQTLSQT